MDTTAPVIQVNGLETQIETNVTNTVVQSVNGIQRYNAQAGIWLLYSTSKVLAVIGFLKLGWGIEGVALATLIAQGGGLALPRRLDHRDRHGDAERARRRAAHRLAPTR